MPREDLIQANWNRKTSIFDLWGYPYLNAFTLAAKKLLALFYIRAGHHKNTLLISSSFFNTKRYKHFKSMRTAILCVARKRSTNCLTSKSFKKCIEFEELYTYSQTVVPNNIHRNVRWWVDATKKGKTHVVKP